MSSRLENLSKLLKMNVNFLPAASLRLSLALASAFPSAWFQPLSIVCIPLPRMNIYLYKQPSFQAHLPLSQGREVNTISGLSVAPALHFLLALVRGLFAGRAECRSVPSLCPAMAWEAPSLPWFGFEIFFRIMPVSWSASRGGLAGSAAISRAGTRGVLQEFESTQPPSSASLPAHHLVVFPVRYWAVLCCAGSPSSEGGTVVLRRSWNSSSQTSSAVRPRGGRCSSCIIAAASPSLTCQALGLFLKP